MSLSEAFVMRAGEHVRASRISHEQTGTHRVPCFGANGLRGYVEALSDEGPLLLVGRQGALCGNVQRVSGKLYATEHAVVTIARDNDIDMNWAYHALTRMNLNQYATASAQPGLAVSRIGALKIAVPSLDEQRRIAGILDQFDALVNDLSIGLPAELAARRQQYQYYRDRLLSFREAA